MPTTKQVIETLLPLQQIDCSDINGDYQQLLTQRILDTGKPVLALTVGELKHIIETTDIEFNGSYADD